jgi:hypothetical protein
VQPRRACRGSRPHAGYDKPDREPPCEPADPHDREDSRRVRRTTCGPVRSAGASAALEGVAIANSHAVAVPMVEPSVEKLVMSRLCRQPARFWALNRPSGRTSLRAPASFGRRRSPEPWLRRRPARENSPRLRLGRPPDLPTDRLSIRIACRTAVWPAETLGSALANVFGEQAEAFELAPLRRADILHGARG